MILREHERASVGARWSDAERELTDRHVGCLLRHQEGHRQTLFRAVHRGLKATSWVGAIGLGDRHIEVLPKIDDEESAAARGNLHAMIAISGLLPAAEAGLARLGDAGKPLLVAYMDGYVRRLALEWRRGPVRRYVTETENRPYLKGKLLLQRQLRDNRIHRERFYTAADELTADNPLARVLKGALGPCMRQSFSPTVARRARSLLLDFDGVADITAISGEPERVEVDRQSERFAPLLQMARFILEQVSPSPVHETARVHSLMFDMNQVFEAFVARMLARVLRPLGYQVEVQASGKALLRSHDKGRFWLRPDVVIRRHGAVVAVVDTKWKRLDPARPYCGVEQSDMYQMYAYGREFRSPRTVLLYPRVAGLAETVATYQHPRPLAVGGALPEIAVTTLDVSRPLAEVGSSAALKEALARVVLGAAGAAGAASSLPTEDAAVPQQPQLATAAPSGLGGSGFGDEVVAAEAREVPVESEDIADVEPVHENE